MSMTSAQARIKKAVRLAIDECSGVEGAAATALRSRSVVGDWNGREKAVFPPLECALALDEIAVSKIGKPLIVAAMARELGGMFVPHIDVAADEGSASAMVMQIAEQLGALSGEVAKALENDGMIDSDEAAGALTPLELMTVKAAQLTKMLTEIRDSKIGPKGRGAK